MKQEHKELLLKDLCARLLYNVKCQIHDEHYVLSGITSKLCDELYFEELDFKECDGYVSIEYCKPCLFPLSSMTEEQKNQLKEIWDADMNKALDYAISGEEGLSDLFQLSAAEKIINWFIENHFDFRGLIPKDLAIDCTNLNIY